MNLVALPSNRRCSVINKPNAIVVYNLGAGALDHDLHDYAYYLLNGLRSGINTAHGHILNLITFVDFLDKKGVSKAMVDSKCLEHFRDDAVKKVLQRATSKGDQRTAETTVDEKLRAVYRWLLWLQTKKRLPAKTIGPIDCRVLCAVASVAEMSEKRRRQMSSLIPLFPLLFRCRGSSASRYKSKAVITRTQQESLVEHFMDAHQSEHARRRNALIADIASAVGFRRDSICSLRVAQFNPSLLLSDAQEFGGSTVEIRPDRQKRNYKNVFDFPSWLAVEVAIFITGPRHQLMKRLGIKENNEESIFVSDRTGRALTPRSVTKIFSSAVRQLGGKPGTSVHALRRLFAMETVENEVDFRVKRGLSTDTESVCRAVALQMGHADWKSLVHYVSQIKRNIERGVFDRDFRLSQLKLQKEIERYRLENKLLKFELAKLDWVSRHTTK